MKKYIIQSIRLTIAMLILLAIIYPMTITIAAKLRKDNGGGEKITKDGKVVGYALLGQSFTKPEYFWSRPSAVNYNAAGSGGSNKGPSNSEYLAAVAQRIDTLLKYHPEINRKDIPADLITASSSGLDPDISVEAAILQIKRVANYRKLTDQTVRTLVEKHINKPVLGLFGPATVNVLQLNIALDELSK